MKKIVKETNNTKLYADAFWKGWFSVFQPLYGVPLELPDLDRGPERDIEAIAGDWRQVGDDLRWAIIALLPVTGVVYLFPIVFI